VPEEITQATSRIRLYDRHGRELAEASCRAPRSWVVGGIGVCKLMIPRSEEEPWLSLLTEENLRYGNRVLVENDEVGDWCGILWPNRTWYPDYVEAVAYTPELMFRRRRTTTEDLSGTAGVQFSRLINMMNARQHTGIVFDTRSYVGGPTWIEPVHREKVFDVVQRIAQKSGQEWKIEPDDRRGRLLFNATWSRRLGVDTEVALIEGKNIEFPRQPLLIEQGDIYNNIEVIAQGTNLEVIAPPAEDEDSIDRYGLSEETYLTEYNSQTSAETLAFSLLERLKLPRRVYNVVALNREDTFRSIRLGNRLRLLLTTTGFKADGSLGTDTTVRVRGYEYDDVEGKIALSVEEY
jgi:hypothetical protein